MPEIDLSMPAFLRNQIETVGLSMTSVKFNSPSFVEVLKIAAQAYQKPVVDVCYAADEYSEIYSAWFRDEIVGTISVTRAAMGPIVFEEHYPEIILNKFRPVLCSAYRLCVAQRHINNAWISKTLMLSCWADELARGMRLAAIHANSRLVPFYKRFGYVAVKNGGFINPRYGTPSQVMVCPANHQHRSAFREICRGVSDEFDLSLLRDVVQIDAVN